MEPSSPATRFRVRLRGGARPTFAVFAAVFLTSAVFTFTRPKVYEATAAWEVPNHRDRVPLPASGVIDRIAGGADLRPSLAWAEGDDMLRRVADRISGDDWHQVLRPYATPDHHDKDLLLRTLAANRRVTPLRLSEMLALTYRHPDPIVAARMANVFADEMSQWASRARADAAATNAYNLTLGRDQLTKRIEKNRSRLADIADAYAAASASPRPTEQELATLALHESLRKDLEGAAKNLAAIKQEFATVDRSEVRSTRGIKLATPPAASDYVSPKHLLDLSLGGALALLAAALTTRLRRSSTNMTHPHSEPSGH